jgi:diacylglycerol kinase (ATP)
MAPGPPGVETAVVYRSSHMTLAALLRPDIPAKTVEPFQRVSPELKVMADLNSAEDLSAALIFGGDGTVHRHLAELQRKRLPVLVVPVGSGNDFAKSLGITNQRVALETWDKFCSGANNVRQIDLGRICSRGAEILFCCVAGAGLDAQSNARANRMPTWLRGRGGYVLATLRALAAGTPVTMTVRAQGIETVSKSWLVAVGNAHRYGGGARITPRAALDDGLLDVCIVKEMSKLHVLWELPKVFWGGHLRLKQVNYFRTAQLCLETEPAIEIYADGEPVCSTPAGFSLLPRAFQVIVPV